MCVRGRMEAEHVLLFTAGYALMFSQAGLLGMDNRLSLEQFAAENKKRMFSRF